MSLRKEYRLLPPQEREFSRRSRSQRWRQLQREPEIFDLVIVGGGIVGAGIAYEATGRGLKVALVEKGDFASGTSSKSSKLLHGGLRYLEHFEFGLVFEALSARNGLFDKFPHLARKVPFLMPIYRHYPERAWFINLGCWVYDVFSWLSSPLHTIRHRWVDQARLARTEPGITQANFEGGLQFFDAYCDDARLVIETLKTAQANGATVLNYAAVTGFVRDGAGQVRGVELQDGLSDETLHLQAKRVINATGPWADHLNRLANPDEPSYLRPTKGVHIIVPRVTQVERAIMLQSVPDASGVARWMFIIPYGEYSLIGTTDTDYAGDKRSDYLDHDNYASAVDVQYLLDSVNAIYPEAHLSTQDVVSSFGGWRPLVSPPGKNVHESQISRDHEIFDTTTGIVMIAGGKLTTYLTMAQDLLHYLRKQDPQAFRHASSNALEPLCNAREARSLDELREQLAPAMRSCSPAQTAYLVQRYGSEAPVVAQLANLLTEDLAPIAGLSEESPLLGAEVLYSVLHEGAVHLNDVLLRRQRVLLRDRSQGQKAARPVAELMASLLQVLLNWSDTERSQWLTQELAAFEAELARTNAWKSEARNASPSAA